MMNLLTTSRSKVSIVQGIGFVLAMLIVGPRMARAANDEGLEGPTFEEALGDDIQSTAKIATTARAFGVKSADFVGYLKDVYNARQREKSGLAPIQIEGSINSCLDNVGALFFFTIPQAELLSCMGKQYNNWDQKSLARVEGLLRDQLKARKVKARYNAGLVVLLEYLETSMSDRMFERYHLSGTFYPAYSMKSGESFVKGNWDKLPLQEGDIMLETTATAKSQINVVVFDAVSRFTHVATYLKDPTGKPYIIDANNSVGVQKYSWESFKRDTNIRQIYILRLAFDEKLVTPAQRLKIIEVYKQKLESRVGQKYNMSLDPVLGPQHGEYTCADLVNVSLTEALNEVVSKELAPYGGAGKVMLPLGYSKLEPHLKALGDELDKKVDNVMAPDDVLESGVLFPLGQWVDHSLAFKAFVSKQIDTYVIDSIVESAEFSGKSVPMARDVPASPFGNLFNVSPADQVLADKVLSPMLPKLTQKMDPVLMGMLKAYLAQQGVQVSPSGEVDVDKMVEDFFAMLETRVTARLKAQGKVAVSDILPSDVEKAMNAEEDENMILRSALRSPLFAKKLMPYLVGN